MVGFEKAYDSINLDYLVEMLGHLNFPVRWIQWIKECVTTVSANVLVNGSPSGEFRLERGIRQGDPLSPYLYLVVAEGLNALMVKAGKEGLIAPATVGRDKVVVSHLQYVDDTLFVLEGYENNAKALRYLFKNFEVIFSLKN